MNVEWKSLDDELPDVNGGYVVLFSESMMDEDEIMIPVSVSNPEYANQTASGEKWTHWIQLPPTPIVENSDKLKIEELRKQVHQWKNNCRVLSKVNDELRAMIDAMAED